MRSDDRDIRELIRPLRRRWWLMAGVALLVSAATYMHYRDQPARYAASTSVFVQRSALDGIGGGSNDTTASRTVKNQAQLLQTRSVAKQVAKDLGYTGSPDALLGLVTATALEDSDFVQIQAVGGTPEAAAAIANGFAKAFVRLRSTAVRDDARKARQDIETQLERLPVIAGNVKLRRTLEARLEQLRVVESVPTGDAKQIDRAVASPQSIGADPVRNAIFAGVLGLILGGLLAYGLEALDRRMHGEEVESEYAAPVLASLPQDRKAVARSQGTGQLLDPLLEPVRSLRTALAVSGNGLGPPRTLLVASALPEEGKTTLTRSLALSYHEAGLKVLVIDCDLRKPSIAGVFGVKAEPGLAEVLMGSATLEAGVQRAFTETRGEESVLANNGSGLQRHDERHIDVLAAGAKVSDPAAMLGTKRMRTTLQQAAEAYDVVLVDTAPLLAVSDTVSLLSEVDGVLVVTRINQTTRDAARRIRTLLSRVPNVRVLGVVANGAEEADAGQIYPYVNSGSA